MFIWVSTLTLHPEALTEVQTKIGKKVAIAHFYTGWSNLVNPKFVNQLQIASNNGWRPMVSANPYFFDKCQANGKTLYQAINSGNCDNFMKNVGISLKQYGHPIFLRFAWEMNIPSMDWSIQKTRSSPFDYISAWQRFHTIVAAQGADNVIWVFAPNTFSSSSIAYNQLYPGDAYVDWVGLDGYNWGTTQSWSSWQSFNQVFSASYSTLTAIAPGKPFMLSEVNTTDVGGDKAAWYTDMLSVQIPYNFPRISAVVFYNEDRTQQEKVNWLIDGSPAALQAFSQGVSLPLYLSSF
jgi:beta-mannanase